MSYARSLLILLVAGALGLQVGGESPVDPSPAFDGAAALAGSSLVGDADCDDGVDSVDALRILRIVAGLDPSDGCAESNGDVDCDGTLSSVDALQILRFIAQLRGGLLPCDSEVTVTIDASVLPSEESLPGLAGGPPRPVGVSIGPDGKPEEYVVNEVILHPTGDDELNSFVSEYGGTILRDGTPRAADQDGPPPGPPEPTGWYLVRVNPDLSPLDEIAFRMEASGLTGHWTFSSEDAARLMGIVAREAGLEVSPNYLAQLDECSVCEHPDGSGGNLDAATWWWMTEDDNPNTPGDQGLSLGVIRAWQYLKYIGYPAVGVPYTPVKVAVIDAGFDLDETTGLPLTGAQDYAGRPPQLDDVDGDWTAGGASAGFANCKACWHGQETFGACCALSRNAYGTAGTTGGWEIRLLLIKITADIDTIAQGLYNAIYNNADVINMSIDFDCGWTCRHFDGGNELKAYVGSARNHGAIVVAAAGNGGRDISDTHTYPCALNGAVCVGAIDRQKKNSQNFGSVVDIWAPECFKTTLTRGSVASDANNTGIDELATFCGSSSSSPYVAGIVALMKMLKGSLSYNEVRSILASTANGSPDPKVRGYVDAYRAVAAVKPNQSPTVSITSPAANSQTPYENLYFSADVNDPETPNMYAWGSADFSSTIVFSSNRDGQLCTDEGDATNGGTSLGCSVASLSLGTHTITATVTDPFGATATDTTTITVVNTTPIAKITFPPTGATYFTSQQINLRGYGFDPDEVIPDSSLEWWTLKSGQVVWVSRGTGPDIWVTLGAGTYTVRLVARDSLGATGTDDITLTVQVGAGYPTVQITSPANLAIFTPGTQITFTGTASDPEDGSLSGSSLRWSSSIDGFLGTGMTVQKVLSGASCTSTVHTITLEATDSDGHKSTHSITVNIVQIC